MKWFKKNQDKQQTNQQDKPTVWSKLQQGLGQQLGSLLFGKKEVDAALLEALEVLLVSADLGIKTTQKI